MARIELIIDDAVNRITLRSLLESAGHTIVSDGAVVCVTDRLAEAPKRAQATPVLVLATANDIREAARVMAQGVFGYIFLPFQPGEATIMVERALQWAHTPTSAGATGTVAAEATQPTLTLDEVEQQHIVQTLRRCKNNQARAARLLGIGRNTLWRKLKKYNPE